MEIIAIIVLAVIAVIAMLFSKHRSVAKQPVKSISKFRSIKNIDEPKLITKKQMITECISDGFRENPDIKNDIVNNTHHIDVALPENLQSIADTQEEIPDDITNYFDTIDTPAEIVPDIDPKLANKPITRPRRNVAGGHALKYKSILRKKYARRKKHNVVFSPNVQWRTIRKDLPIAMTSTPLGIISDVNVVDVSLV